MAMCWPVESLQRAGLGAGGRIEVIVDTSALQL